MNAFNGVGVRITIRFDVSPWGLGGVLLKEEVPVAWIAAPLTEDDIDILGVKQAIAPHNKSWSDLHG